MRADVKLRQRRSSNPAAPTVRHEAFPSAEGGVVWEVLPLVEINRQRSLALIDLRYLIDTSA
jgi:hypothetical protein